MSAALPIPVIQLLQVLTVALGALGVTGVIAKVEARLQASSLAARVAYGHYGRRIHPRQGKGEGR